MNNCRFGIMLHAGEAAATGLRLTRLCKMGGGMLPTSNFQTAPKLWSEDVVSAPWNMFRLMVVALMTFPFSTRYIS